MTREEATTLLAQVLIDLARNSVHNKRLTDYADELERYIASLEEQEKAEEVENTNTEAE